MRAAGRDTRGARAAAGPGGDGRGLHARGRRGQDGRGQRWRRPGRRLRDGRRSRPGRGRGGGQGALGPERRRRKDRGHVTRRRVGRQRRRPGHAQGRHESRPGHREQVVGELTAGLVAGLRRFRKSLADDAEHLVRHRRVELAQGRGLLRDDLDEEGGDRLAAEGLLAGHHLVEDAADREEVAAPVDDAAPGLLRAHVGRRPEQAPGHREVLAPLVGHLRDAEVGDPHVVPGLDHDVRGLDVAVDDAVLVRVAQSVRHLGPDRRRALDRHLARPRDHPVEPHAVHELHREVAEGLRAPPVVEADDVGVLEVGGDPGLLLEALEEVVERGDRRGEALEADRLDRHEAAELLVLRLVDGAERAGAQLLLDDVASVDLGRLGDGGLAGAHGLRSSYPGGQPRARPPRRCRWMW